MSLYIMYTLYISAKKAIPDNVLQRAHDVILHTASVF